jgi:hypothetical protein
MGMDSSPDTHVVEVVEPQFAGGGEFYDSELSDFDPGLDETEVSGEEAMEDTYLPAAETGQYWDEIDRLESGESDEDVSPGTYGQSVEGLPSELRFGGYSGSYGEVDKAWYSSDGKVYDSGGHVLGYH